MFPRDIKGNMPELHKLANTVCQGDNSVINSANTEKYPLILAKGGLCADNFRNIGVALTVLG